MSQTIQACLWMIGAIVSFSSMAVAGRAVSFDLDTFEIMLYRSAIGVLVVLSLSSVFQTRGQINTRHMGLHTARNIFHFAGQNLWFAALTLIPLAQVFALEFTSPLWVIALSPLVLGERVTRTRLICAGLGFVGVLIVTLPSGAQAFNIGVLFAALAAVGFAGSAVFTRRLTRTEGITCILFWLTLMQLVFGLICAGIDGDIALPSAQSWPLVVVISLAGLLAHFCLTKALSMAPATLVMPIDFTRLPIIIIVGMLVYSEPFQLHVLLGAGVIFAAVYLMIWSETRAKA